jgi:hypothetical protein
MPGEIRRLNEAKVVRVPPLLRPGETVGGGVIARRRSYSYTRSAEGSKRMSLPAISNLPSLLLITPPAPNTLSPYGFNSLFVPFLQVPLPKYGLAYHAFRPPRPRARSWCSCGKRGSKDQSLAFGHLSTSDYLPCLLYSLCHCK